MNNEISDRLKGVNAKQLSSNNESTFLLTTLPETTTNRFNLSTNALNNSSTKNKFKSAYLELPSSITNASSIGINDKISLKINPFGHSSNDFDDCEDVEEGTETTSLPTNVRRTMSENNFIEKYRAMKLDLDQQQKTTQKAGTMAPHDTNTSSDDNDINNNNNNSYSNDLGGANIFDLIDENYAYMLLYSQSYDNIRVLFVLRSFDKILKQCKKDFILALCKTKVFDNEIQTFYNTKLLDLFIRHLKSIYGHNFYSNSNSEFLQHISKHLNLKNLTYLEIILFILMFYIRSFSIQNLQNGEETSAKSKQNTREEVCGNKNVQIYCIQILSKLIQELISISQNVNSNIFLFDDLTQFSQYVYEMLDRCNIQKTLLHCLFSSTTTAAHQERTLTKLIIDGNLRNINQQTQYASICELINCIQILINLEYVLSAFNLNSGKLTPHKVVPQSDNDDYLITKSNASQMKFFQSTQTSTQTSRYIQHLPIISQSMFISSVLYYLRHLSLFEFHLPILNLIRNSLPFTGTALKSWNAFIIEQLSANLMQIVSLYEIKAKVSGSQTLLKHQQHQFNLLANINIPDFFVLIIKQLSCLLHFSLLISNSSSANLNKSNNSNSSDNESSIHESFQNDPLIKSQKQVNVRAREKRGFKHKI